MGIEHFLYVDDLEILVYICLSLAVIIFLYGLYRGYRRWFIDEAPPIDNFGARLVNLLRYGLLQAKVFYKFFIGTLHGMVFIGFIVLLIGTLLRALEYDIFIRFLDSRILVSGVYLVFKLSMNIGGAIAIIGLSGLVIRRLVFKPKYLPNMTEDIIIPLLLLYILITGFFLDGVSTWAYRRDWIGPYDPIGMFISVSLDKYPWIVSLYRVVWLTHMSLAIFMVAYIPYTKLFHMISGGILNTFFARDYHPSAFRSVPNIDEIVEQGGYPGAGRLSDFTWKERMDYDACIKCARCTENCPATLTGKVLSPMNIILDLRRAMDDGDFTRDIIPSYIDPEALWSCVTCGACVYQCPMLIHHVESIIDMRRYLFGVGEHVPDEVLEPSYNIMRYGNPMGNDPMDRKSFLDELVNKFEVVYAEEGVEYDYLYWIGCQSSYDPNARGIVEAMFKLFSEAGVKAAVLRDEGCCGEPVRRIGDELLFKDLVSSNGEKLSKYKFKYLVVNCPHGYNVFKHEYPLFGYNFNVLHHTQLINKFIEEGKINPAKKFDVSVTFHDPCYLGRWNGVFEEPRSIVRSVAGNLFREMPRSRERSFCCGGGGGHLFFEIKRGERISKVRVEEAINMNARILAVACPFCKIMLGSEAPQELLVRDVSELITGD